MGSKGTGLKVGDIMLVGDYLQSSDGWSRVSLESTGLHLYWMGPVFTDRGWQAWQSGLYASASDLFVIMQGDGNLCCYAGTPSAPGRLLWQCGIAKSGPDRYAVIQDDGNFCVYPPTGAPATWCTNCAKQPSGTVQVLGVSDRKPPMLITMADPHSSRATMQESSKDFGNKQVFALTKLIVQNQNYGIVLTNLDNGRLLGAWPQEFSEVGTWNGITEDTILLQVDPGEGAPAGWVGLRPLSGNDNHFNVPGDGPYQPGSKIIMYHWVRPATPNMLWQIQYLS